ncbi:type II toxin-antitoxin system death-on-curing family toxin [Aureimonas leprariae]|uniref:Type II toxin-antitoxin system death-on-curing family toxin n=1 Tax=Plantimonas leprariae TaxID=2615207 RepID=A0A7V7PQZ5_9HYPH|nr:type II toxin-antitoxin system death-on-curing family toxin [Aureimonas leprariae]KAB0680875.1 type II toxin-antitoxin system death-on-curing family toxin [Aureimonas leprariae]
MRFALPDRETILDAHEQQIAAFGGLSGVRDEGLLDSALARPANLLAYGAGDVDICQVAASLGYGLAKNHAFFDGNKRTSLAATYLVLAYGGYRIVAHDEALFETWQALAAGTIGERELADWLRANIELRRE